MSRYRGRHRAAPSSLIQRHKVALPVVTMATVGAAAAGVHASAATGHATHASASMDLSGRSGAQDVSRSAQRPSAADAAALARTAAASAARAKADAGASSRAAAARSAALRSAATSAAAARSAHAKTLASASSRSSSRTTLVGYSTGSGWTCAIAGCGGTFTSGYGARVSPGGIGSTYHLGDDFATPIGTPLHAMHSGTVTAVGWFGGQGKRVEVDFGNGVTAVYAHMSRFSTYVGEHVSEGEIIGYSGNTGNSTGAHLHLEIHLNGVAVNPAPWLRAHGIF